jgi:antitoxin (DNA-binding transcriptional repressor) of toxin-antitoxin stability system
MSKLTEAGLGRFRGSLAHRRQLHLHVYFLVVLLTLQASRVSPANVWNLSRGKNATASATYGNGTTSNAVDGNYENMDLTKCVLLAPNNTASRFPGYSWWTVDLGDLYIITSVIIYAPAILPDSTYLRQLTVWAETDYNSQTTYTYVDAVTPGGNVTVTFSSLRVARYVTIRRDNYRYNMTLCEVDVIGTHQTATPKESVSLTGKPTNQSGTYGNRSASYAVDGNYDRTNPDKCATAFQFNISQSQYTAWWQVDLQGLYIVDNVTIYIPKVLPDQNYVQSVFVYVSVNSTIWAGTCGYSYGPSQNGTLVTVCNKNPPLVSRFVTIQQNTGPYSPVMTICEVEIRGVRQNLSETDPALFGYRPSSTPPRETSNESYRGLAIAAIVIASVFALFSIIMLIVCLAVVRGHQNVLKQGKRDAKPNKYQMTTPAAVQRTDQPPPTPNHAQADANDDLYDDVIVNDEPANKKGKQNWKRS